MGDESTSVAVTMMSILDETFFYYRHKCGFDVMVDTEESRVVLPVGRMGAIVTPVHLVPVSIEPTICHPGGALHTILTDGDSRLTKAFRARLRQANIAVVDPGDWVVLPMCGQTAESNSEQDWSWAPTPPRPDTPLPRPSTVYAALNATLGSWDGR